VVPGLVPEPSCGQDTNGESAWLIFSIRASGSI
jgi:hypothetical protein